MSIIFDKLIINFIHLMNLFIEQEVLKICLKALQAFRFFARSEQKIKKKPWQSRFH